MNGGVSNSYITAQGSLTPTATTLQTITVTPPRERATNQLEYETIARLRLKPGRHEVRVAAEDAARDLRDSDFTYVDVPDFANAPRGRVQSDGESSPPGECTAIGRLPPRPSSFDACRGRLPAHH